MTPPWLVVLGVLVGGVALYVLCVWLCVRPVRAGHQPINPPPPPPPLRTPDGFVNPLASPFRMPQGEAPASPAVVVQWLAPRRACLEGARDTLLTVAATLENADTMEAAHKYLDPIVWERLLLLELALRQFDDALAGREPEPSP